jgi:hypothetical protein
VYRHHRLRAFLCECLPYAVISNWTGTNEHPQEGQGIFSGLAHWIKGGVFFWLGIFTLGRWAGSFGELGWVGVPLFFHL